MYALFNGKGLRAEVRGFLRERAYGQNDVLQPYDLPVTSLQAFSSSASRLFDVLQPYDLPVTRGGVCARLGAEATDYGLRATRKPVPL